MKCIKVDEEGYRILIKESIEQEEIVKINVCAQNTRISSFLKEILMDLKGDVNSNEETQHPNNFNG